MSGRRNAAITLQYLSNLPAHLVIIEIDKQMLCGLPNHPCSQLINILLYGSVCSYEGDGRSAAATEWLRHTNKHAQTRAQKLLTVMYLTSMSVFLSSSVIISLWNLLNFRWGGEGARERRGEKDTLVNIHLMGGWSATVCQFAVIGEQGKYCKSQRDRWRVII